MMLIARYARVFFGIASFAFIPACAALPSIKNISLAPVNAGKNLVTDEDVRGTIVRAGGKLGWVMRDEDPRKLIATLKVDKSVAVVAIDFQMSMYSIRYKDSSNLKYTAKPKADMGGTIHDPYHATIEQKYNDWIQALDQAIQRELAEL